MNGNEIRCSTIVIQNPDWASRAADFALLVLDSLQKRDWQISLVFCDDSSMQKLNRDYRAIDSATDVLSFPLGAVEPSKRGRKKFIAGDIVISVEALERNSKDFSVSKDEELRRLIVHGILHLSGMDHEDNSAKQPMLVQQEELLSKLNWSIFI